MKFNVYCFLSLMMLMDIIGRQVSVVVPAERVALASARDIHIFDAVAGKDGLRKIVGWGAMVRVAGGTNIAEGIIPKGATVPINPEYLLKENPDVIIVTGSCWSETKDAMRLGYYADFKESRELLLAFARRPGWDALSAAQDGRVYSVFHPWVGLPQHFAAIQSFAKWFYPDEFMDLNPEENLKEFCKEFLSAT